MVQECDIRLRELNMGQGLFCGCSATATAIDVWHTLVSGAVILLNDASRHAGAAPAVRVWDAPSEQRILCN